MPSVGMRRTTRVFGARVLRSGRQLRAGPGVGKYMKSTNGDEWIELLENSADGDGGAIQRKERAMHANDIAPNQEVIGMDIDENLVGTGSRKVEHEGLVADDIVERRWGAVYTRKRKKVDSSVVEFSVNAKRDSDDKRFGKQFFRRRRTKISRQQELAEACYSNVVLVPPVESLDDARSQPLMVAIDSSCSSWCVGECFLNSVLRYMRRVRLGISKLSAFLHSQTIAHVFSSCGIRFLQGCNLVTRPGVCMIWDACCLVPVFAADYSAVPYCFMYLHSRMLLQSAFLACSLGLYSVGIDEKYDQIITSSMLIENDHAPNVMVASRNDYSGKRVVSPSKAGALACSKLRLRSGHIVHERSSLRSKRDRRPSSFVARKATGASASNLFNLGHNGIQLSPESPRCELRTSAQSNAAKKLKQVKSAVVGLKQDVGPTGCCANILITESDRCRRVERAIVTLEISSDKQWHLAVKGDGVNRCNIIAQKFMRPSSCNRFTHAITWNIDSGWKLEFPDRQDWLIFKELYKECFDRNAQIPVENFIPVPGVHEVSDYDDSSTFFLRPTSYISTKEDELSRALARTVNYDMDSDDEQWLNNFNISAGTECQKLLSAEKFELAIDAFERGYHCNPDDFADENNLPNLSLNLESRVVEAVYKFWSEKRRQRRGALIRIFQLYKPRKSPLLPNDVQRKKRSFNRQGSRNGRAKRRPFLRAQQDARQQQNAVLKVEEAKAVANRSEELAILKRQRAQQLMENADLATYKAAMAVKIAELAQIAGAPPATVGPFFPVLTG